MGRFQKGQPSANPLGRGAPFARAEIDKARSRAAPGSDGVIAYGGYIQTNETSSALTGSRKWTTYANAFAHPAVAVASILRAALLSGVKWTLTENPAGGKLAQRGIEIIEQGLLYNTRLAKPWPKVVSKAGMHWFNGFSLHAASVARRPDGTVVFADLGHRPPHTIEQWHRATPQDPWDSVTQRIGDGNTYQIDLDDCLYLVNDALTDSPEGVGVLRLIAERIRRIGLYEKLEGSEMFSSMGGLPIARAPIEEIVAGTSGDVAAKQAAVNSATSKITTAVSDRIKTPSEQQWLMLDSTTFRGSNPDTISSTQKWGVEIVKGDLQGLADIRKVITDEDLNVARILGVEFVFVGGGDTAGSFGMHESKVSMFAAAMQTSITEIATAAEAQLVRRLIRANGLDPDVAAPYLVPSPIGTKDVEKAARTLGLLQMAALPPNHPAKIAVFEALDLPWQDETDLGMSPRRPMPFGPTQGGGPADVAPTEPEPEETVT
jgi:hypothetical protein